MNRSLTPIFTDGPELRNYAEAHGDTTDDPSQSWILTPVDVWVKNPYYTGKPTPHPEDDRD